MQVLQKKNSQVFFRGGSRTAATSKMEHFVIIVNGWKLFFVSVSIFQKSLQKSQNMALSGCFQISTIRGRSRASATSKMERFVIIVNGWIS